MEKKVYEVPRLLITPYRVRLGAAMNQIRERYEDLGLENASPRDPVNRKIELGYFLEGKLVIFEVIDELELLKESDTDALATNKLIVEGKTIISLQKILLEMDSDILAIVLQQQLDEVLLISEGYSSLEAQRLAIQAQKTQDREKVAQALKTRLLVIEATIKDFLPKKEELIPKTVTPPLEKKVIDKVVVYPRERPKRRIKTKKKKESKHPGKNRLEELIKEHQARIFKIANDLNVGDPTVSRWINEDTELERLAKEQRKARRKKFIKHDLSKIKTIDELKTILVSGERKSITWGDLHLGLHKALVVELAREAKKEVSKLTQTDYKNNTLSVLNGRNLNGLLVYWGKRNTSDKTTVRFILEELELVERTLTIKEIKTLEQLKSLLTSGAIKQIAWSELRLEFHKALVIKLALETKKEVSELFQSDYFNTELPSLNQRKLGGLYVYWSKKKTADKTTCRFILEKLGLVKKALTIKEIETLEQLKNLLTSGAIRRISWHNLPLEIHKALIQELSRETGKKTSELTQIDYGFRLSVLNQQTLGGFYRHWTEKNKTDKSVTRFILEELDFVEKTLTLREVRTKKQLKRLFLTGVKMKSWGQVHPRVQRSLVRELAWKLNKKVEELIREDYDALLSGLGEKSILGIYQYYAKKNKTTKRAALFILEELELVERTKEIGEIKEPKELKQLLVSKAIITIRWANVSRELQIALIKELAKTAKKEISQLRNEDFARVPLDSLNGKFLKDMYLHFRKQNKAKKPTVWYILEKLELVTTIIKPFEEVTSTDELKEMLDLGAIKQVSWLRLNKQVQAMLVKELATLLEKPIEKLVQDDYVKVPLPSLAGNTLGGLHLHYLKRNISDKKTTRFILAELSDGLELINREVNKE